MAIAAPLAKTYGMNKAVEMAYEQLGIEAPKESMMEQILTGGGIQQAFNPTNLGNMVKRGAVRAGINTLGSGVSGVAVPMMLGSLALAYNRNPLRPGSANYNPALRGQMQSLSRRGMLGTDQSGLQKIISGPLRGKNLVSLFGTNDYDKMLENRRRYFENRIAAGKNYGKKQYAEVLQEIEKRKPTTGTNKPGTGGGGGDGGGGGGSSFSTEKKGKEGAFGTFDGSKGRKDYRKGGIASL